MRDWLYNGYVIVYNAFIVLYNHAVDWRNRRAKEEPDGNSISTRIYNQQVNEYNQRVNEYNLHVDQWNRE